MKTYIHKIILALALSFAFFSCESDLEERKTTVKQLPENVQVNTTNPFVCSEINITDTAFVFTWSAADLGEGVSCSYTLLFDVAGGDFSSAYELDGGNNTLSKGVTSSQLNTMMHKLGQPISVSKSIEVKISAKPLVQGSAKPNLNKAVSTTFTTIYVTSFAMEPLHIMGSLFGPWTGTNDYYSWDPNNYRYVMFRDDPLATDQLMSRFHAYEAVSIFEGEFVFLPNSRLGTYSSYGKQGIGILAPGGANIKDILTTGYYTVAADITKMTYSITPYDASGATVYSSVELAGAGVGATPIALTQTFYDNHMWSVDDVVLTTGNVSIMLDGAAQGGATFPWGKVNASATTINVLTAGTYFVRYSDLTGHYVFYKK